MSDKQPTKGRGYGILLALGLLIGFVVGLVVGQPSAGVLIGLGIGAALALGLGIAGY